MAYFTIETNDVISPARLFEVSSVGGIRPDDDAITRARVLNRSENQFNPLRGHGGTALLASPRSGSFNLAQGRNVNRRGHIVRIV